MKLWKRICLLALAVITLAVLTQLWYRGVFVTDRSAEVRGDYLSWKGREYTRISTNCYKEGRTIAKSADGSWKINAVKEDLTHTFVVVRSFLDQYVYVAADYTIPTDGEITKVFWCNAYIDDQKLMDAITAIDKMKTTSFEYKTDAIYYLDDNQRMKELTVAYGDCPVATVKKGWLGKINGQWVVTTYISPAQSSEDSPPLYYTVGCYVIPEAYWPALEMHFFE